jgi:queuine tRNA-ribosyltransferase
MGCFLHSKGIINIRNRKWMNDYSPIDPNGTIFADTHHSKAYLRHLFVAGEMLGPMLATLHNLSFYLWLVTEARKHILNNNFIPWKNLMIPKLKNRL